MSENEYNNNGNGMFSFGAVFPNTTQYIPAGRYLVKRSMALGWYLQDSPVTIADSYVPLPNPAANKTLDLVQTFLNGDLKEPMAAMGMVHKLACMLWGDPGTSKSVTIYEVTKRAIEAGCIVIDAQECEIKHLEIVLQKVREIEPTRPIVVIYEEVDGIIDYQESAILQLLDGASQFNDVLYLFTTNYIKEIPDRVFLRYRRIPFQVRFLLPDRECREAYFKAKIPAKYLINGINWKLWLDTTEGFSLDQCAQTILSVFAFNKTLEEVVEDLEERKAALKQ